MLFLKLIIELKKLLAKNVDLDELYSEIFLIFRFNTLLIDISLDSISNQFKRE